MKIIQYIILFIFPLNLHAQYLQAGALVNEGNIEVNDSWPHDNNNECSTKIVIESNLDSLEISCDIISIQNKTSEGNYEIYLFPPQKNTKKLIIRHENYSIVEVPVWEENNKALKRGNVYKLIIEGIDLTTKVNINTKPVNASVLIDEEYYGNTSTQLNLMKGTYSLKLVKSGYATISKVLIVPEGESIDKFYELKEAEESKLVELSFIAPVNSKIQVDKKTLSYPFVEMVIPGKHQIEYILNGNPKTVTWDIQKDVLLDLTSDSDPVEMTNPSDIISAKEDITNITGSNLENTPSKIKSNKTSTDPATKSEILQTSLKNTSTNDKLKKDLTNLNAVDLGLPSGTLWSDKNVGSISEIDYGYYYSWGEIAQNLSGEYNKNTCKTYQKPLNNIRNIDYDVTKVLYGKDWSIPTKYQIQELIEKCAWIWVNRKGKNGFLVVGPNGESIFLPAGGGKFNYDNFDVNTYGNYWSSTSDDPKYEKSSFLFFKESGPVVSEIYRTRGFTIRPVTNSTK